MNRYSISSHDTWEISFYFLHGYSAEHIRVIPKNGAQICQFTITGDNRLRELQEEYFNNPEIKLKDFRSMMHRVNTLMGSAKKRARQKVNDLSKGGL